MNGLAAFRFSSMRQSAKALFKPKEQNQQLIYQSIFLKNLAVLTKQKFLYKIKADDQYWLSAFYI
jgi:hypothetical protein